MGWHEREKVMPNKPSIMITGFPGSGTSLIAGLTYTLGIPMGPLSKLKMSGSVNPRGYYEHIPIAHTIQNQVFPNGFYRPYHGPWNCGLVWTELPEGKFCKICGRQLTEDGEIADDSVYGMNTTADPTTIDTVQQMAEEDNVVAIKHCAFPFIHNYFPHITKCIAIYRSPESLTQPTTSLNKRLVIEDGEGQRITDPEFLAKYYIAPSHDHWWGLFSDIIEERNIPVLGYEYPEWKGDFNNCLDELAAFVEVDITPNLRQECRNLLVL